MKPTHLLSLAPYGVTNERLNERLDEVSNYCRCVRSRGASWPATPAVAYAVRRSGVITGCVVTSGGSGYSSAPTVTVPGASLKAELAFSKVFATNGSVSVIAIPSAKAK